MQKLEFTNGAISTFSTKGTQNPEAPGGGRWEAYKNYRSAKLVEFVLSPFHENYGLLDLFNSNEFFVSFQLPSGFV